MGRLLFFVEAMLVAWILRTMLVAAVLLWTFAFLGALYCAFPPQKCPLFYVKIGTDFIKSIGKKDDSKRVD